MTTPIEVRCVPPCQKVLLTLELDRSFVIVPPPRQRTPDVGEQSWVSADGASPQVAVMVTDLSMWKGSRPMCPDHGPRVVSGGAIAAAINGAPRGATAERIEMRAEPPVS